MKEIWTIYHTYKVSSFGNIISLKTNKLLSTRLDNCGYTSVTMTIDNKRTRVRVHRLVGKLFIDNSDNLPEIDHLDNNRQNPNASNLRWVTHQENIKHTLLSGNHICQTKNHNGENNNNSKLTSQQVLEIRNLYKIGVKRSKIAKIYTMSWTMIDDIVKYNNWNCVGQ